LFVVPARASPCCQFCIGGKFCENSNDEINELLLCDDKPTFSESLLVLRGIATGRKQEQASKGTPNRREGLNKVLPEVARSVHIASSVRRRRVYAALTMTTVGLPPHGGGNVDILAFGT
jgi:hypothetical protein